MNILRHITLAVIMILLNACSMLPIRDHHEYFDQIIFQENKDYIQYAAQHEGAEKQHYTLLAANQHLVQNNFFEARRLLETLPEEALDTQLLQEKQVLKARLLLKQGFPAKAMTVLRTVHLSERFSQEMNIIYDAARAEALARTHHLAESVLVKIELNEMLSENPLALDIWNQLQTLSLQTTRKLRNKEHSPVTQGWLDLSLIAKQHAHQTTSLVNALFSWQQGYPAHPAAIFLPDHATLDSLKEVQSPTHLALLLPLQGPYGQKGQAVRDGLMTAFYADHNSPQREIKIYDTSQTNDISALYQLALNEGAECVIGPLIPAHVMTLADHGDFPVPTLVLTSLPERHSLPQNLIQFDLSWAQDAYQVADYAWLRGVNHLLMIIPENENTQAIAHAFSARFQEVGGEIRTLISFKEERELSTAISEVLNVDQSRDRIHSLEQILKQKLKVIPRRRQDIDGVFMMGTPEEAREIIPLLRFYYANQLPVFSIGSIYEGWHQSKKDQDLNGAYFRDMPWLVSQRPTIQSLRKRVQSFWPQAYKTQHRLYALGIDSYKLSTLLSRLMVLPAFPIDGMTGKLSINDQHQITRSLTHTRFSQGIPKMVRY